MGGRWARREVDGVEGQKEQCHPGHAWPRAMCSLGESHLAPQAVTGAHAAGTRQLHRWFRRFWYMWSLLQGQSLQTRDTEGGEGIHQGP